MWDTATPSAIPIGGAGCDATAGYIPGCRYPSSEEIRRRVPNKPHLTICTTANADAMCLDVEPRYATPDQTPAWVDRQHARGMAMPVVYTMASWSAAVRQALGGRQYLLWSAHYGLGRAHICGTDPYCIYPLADATQWANHGPNGENVDQSLLSDRFFAAIGGLGPVPTKHAAPPPDMFVGQDQFDGLVYLVSGNTKLNFPEDSVPALLDHIRQAYPDGSSPRLVALNPDIAARIPDALSLVEPKS